MYKYCLQVNKYVCGCMHVCQGQEGKGAHILGKLVLTNNIPLLNKSGSWCHLSRRYSRIET
jgi:hypothetical protein